MVSAGLRMILACCLASAALLPARADPPIPALTGRVVDQAHIIDASTVASLNHELAGFEQSTGDQVVVVTLPDLKDYSIEQWGRALGNGWGIGQSGRNNGVLLIVAPADRRLRIEVGNGLQSRLPDSQANEIIQSEIIPRFKEGDMPRGIQYGVDAILASLRGSYSPPPRQAVSTGSGFPVGPFFIFALFFFAVVIINFRRRAGPAMPMQPGYPYRGLRTYSGFGSSGFRAGGFSSGGGGFHGGGGSFGGGGASGRW
ncbi:MAG TPA: TPM domain-containing protein [Candidatus Cybelea sp.]|nr:TPM domain-containing protein [Candidatus Cybelea sp.]